MDYPQAGQDSIFADGAALKEVLGSVFRPKKPFSPLDSPLAIPFGMRRCSRCGQIKAKREFYADHPALKACLSQSAQAA